MRTAIVVGVALALLALPLAARADTKLEIYGHADVSYDYADPGTEKANLKDTLCPPGPCKPVNPYTQMSSNNSYLGFRVTQDLGDSGLKGLMQIESSVAFSEQFSDKNTLGSRDTYVGLGGGFGAVKLGKSDSPYKKSTGRFDPFANTVGDYNSIMGNTGGDGRAEFDLRLPHAAWYESATMGGFNFQLMAAPGQNRNVDNLNAPQGDYVCAGSTAHQSGADPFGGGPDSSCSDGSFGDAYSGAFNYSAGPLFATAAYEVHQRVNRTSDTNGVVGDETAWKAGVQYKYEQTTVGAIYESLDRSHFHENKHFDERTRDGYYLSGTQRVADVHEVSLAWAHANATPGVPDWTTTPTTLKDEANMYAVGYRKYLSNNFSLYAVLAEVVNNAGAHYILGAGGHGVPIWGRDGHSSTAHCDPNWGCNAFDPSTGLAKAITVSSFSVGMRFLFSAPFEVTVAAK